MKIPSSYRKITVKQFIDCIKIYKGEGEQLDKDNQILSYLTGKPIDYIEGLDFKTLKFLYSSIAFLKSSTFNFIANRIIFIGFKPYKLVTDVSKFNTSEYLTFKTLQERGASENIHKILPYLYRPLFTKFTKQNCFEDVKNVEYLESKFLKNKVSTVYGAVFFYSKRSEKLNKRLEIYFTNKIKAMNLHIKEVLKAQDMQA